MAGSNIYNPQGVENERDFADGVADFTKNLSVIGRAPGAIFGGLSAAGSVGLNALTGWIPNQIPLIGGGFGTGVGGTVTNSAKATVENVTKVSGVDKLFAGVTFAARGFQAVGELMEGDNVGAAGKVARGAAEAAAVMFTLTGPIGLVIELGSKLTTGKFLATHFGDLAENVATGALGGTKEQREAQQIQGIRAGIPAAAVMVPAGIAAAGLAANHLMTKNGQNLTLGGLPGNRNANGQELGAVTLDAAPVLPNQVMDVSYTRQRAQELPYQETKSVEQEQEPQPQPAQGKSPTFWREKMAAEGRGRAMGQGQNNETITSGSPLYAEAASKAEAILQQREQLQNKELTHAY